LLFNPRARERGVDAATRTPGSSALRPTSSWWWDEAVSAGIGMAPCEPLVGSHEFDVTIVGGGYTGLWTALALRERAPHLRVAVLEAQVCGAGASGKNGGFVHGYWEAMPKVASVFGAPAALELARMGSAAQKAITRFCQERPEDVWLTTCGMTKGATSEGQEQAIIEELDLAGGLPEEFRPRPLSAVELQRVFKTDAFRRGAWFSEGATVHPVRLALAMKNAGREAGVSIFESSAVIGVDTAPQRTVLTTATGTVSSRDVVMATNAWLSDRLPYSRHLTNLGSYMLVTEPIPEFVSGLGSSGSFALKDARMFLNWARSTRDGRLVVGNGAGPMSYRGRISKVHSQHQASADRALEALRRFFPGTADAKVHCTWGGAIDMSADRLPFFGTLPGTRVHYGVGYSGHGVNAAWIGGQILSSLVTGERDAWSTSMLCARQVAKFPIEPFRYLGGRVIHANMLRLEDALDSGRRPPLTASAIAAVPRLFGLRIGTR
jgi:glycine/D-amino acid oxidase-like deaminating enzyme